MKFVDWIYKKVKGIQLKNLSKVACVYNSDTYTKYLIPGEKTKAKFQAMRAIICCIDYVYGRKAKTRLQLTGLRVSEDDSCITVDVYTARPGLVIGKMGKDIDKLMDVLTSVFGVITKVSLHEEPVLYGNRCIELY